MTQNNSKSNAGFTIIEVLIVLAIAGLILLIVFLAVPALQRNARNTGYKEDAASLLAAASEYTNNNNGTLPTNATQAQVQALAKTKNITNLTVQTGSVAAIASPANFSFSTAVIDTGVKCPAAVAGSSVTPVASSTRAMIIVYAVEDSAGAVVAQCTES